jgi:hypothetical protein
MGYLLLELKDYLSVNTIKKSFYKFFHVNDKDINYGWGLEGSIGLIPS